MIVLSSRLFPDVRKVTIRNLKIVSTSCLVKKTRILRMHAHYCLKMEGKNVIMGIKDLSR